MVDQNQMIAAQLQSVSRAFLTMDNDELMSVLLDTCSALLDEVEMRRPAVSNMDQTERSEYTIGYKQISRLVGHYAQELLEVEPVSGPAEDPTDSMDRLEQLRREAEDQRSRNQALEAELAKNSEELKSLHDFYDTMTEMGKACTREIIDAQKRENEQILSQVDSRQKELEELTRQKMQHTEILRNINDSIRRVEEEIAQIPDVQKELAAAHGAKCAELNLLRNARELCSAERQAEVEQQILELKPTVEKLEQQMNTLSGQLQNFKDSRTELDRENQILRTDLLDCIDSAMGELRLAIGEHQQTLAEIRCQADTYRTSLAECERTRSGLVQWLGSDRRQFDAALAAIDRQEYTNLQQTLNLSAQNQIQESFSQAQTALEKVDQLLKQCAKAAQMDQVIVKRKAAVQ